MLKKLTIQNYALIEKVEMDFSKGVNIITGETGAGKSILMGALSLILGERADAKALLNQEIKCVIEGVFELEKNNFIDLFEANEIDFDTATILRREISNTGKSRAFINDTPVNLSVLKLFAEQWINLHNQHQTLELVDAGFQLSYVDSIAGLTKAAKQFKKDFGAYRLLLKEIEQLIATEIEQKKQLDFIQFQYQELAAADLLPNEQSELEDTAKILSNAEEIKQNLQGCKFILEDNETSVLVQLSQTIQLLKNADNYSTTIVEIKNRLLQTKEELNDIYREIDAVESNTEGDPSRLAIVNERLDLIYKLQKKHNVNSIDELIVIAEDLSVKLNAIQNNSTQITQLEKKAQQQKKQLIETALQLHKQRNAITADTAKKINTLLQDAGMPNANFQIQVELLDEKALNENGLSEVKFLFSANKGFALSEIKNVASGGELSRLMLCIKAILADKVALPSLVFDEIDTGISGEVAYKVGDIMHTMSHEHQLICITHLPQIARIADKHFYIYKTIENETTKTQIKTLNAEEKINEIAKMLSGEKITEAAVSNAKALLNI